MAGVEGVARKVAKDLGISIDKAKDVVESVFFAVQVLADEGELVIIRGFGSFQNKTFAAHEMTAFEEGKKLMVREMTKLRFKPSRSTY